MKTKHPLPISSSNPEQLILAPVLQQQKDPHDPVSLPDTPWYRWQPQTPEGVLGWLLVRSPSGVT